MKILAIGPSPEEEQELRRFCQRQCWDMSVIDRWGRPRVKVPVDKLSDAYRRYHSVRAAAASVGCAPATAWDRLKDAGVLDKVPPVI